MPTDDEFEAAKRHGVELLSGLPGVDLVGGGSKEVGGVLTGEPAIKVYVTRKLPMEQIPEAERVPDMIDGVRTDVVETGGIHLAAGRAPGAVRPGDFDPGDDYPHRDPALIGGSQIKRDGSWTAGTLGCFVWNTSDHTQAWALTCYHIVGPKDAPAPVLGTTEVGQPDAIRCSGCCNDMIGKYAGGRIQPTPETSNQDRDEALVRLDPGTKWVADVLEIGASGTDDSGKNGALQGSAPALTQVPGAPPVTRQQAESGTYQVRKRGRTTRLTGGVLSTLADGDTLPNNILVIKPNPPSSPSQPFFAWEGDSGSVLVNDTNQVIGLVYARDGKGHGYALTITGVLSRLGQDLGVTLDVASANAPGTVNQVPGAAMVAVPREVVSALAPALAADPDPPASVLAPAGQWALPGPPPRSFGHVEKDLDRSAPGRRLAAIWHEHQAELSRLVNTNRRLAATWHRSGGAAIFQLLARMTMDPAVRMPETVNGQPLALCADRVHAILARSASPCLRTDLDWIRGWLPGIAGLTYPQILQTLDRT